MNKERFEELFDEYVSEPLVKVGFIRKGMSLYFLEGETHLALIRGGGQLSGPCHISLIGCFRHAFLRDKREKVPNSISVYPEDFPWIFSMDELVSGRRSWAFNPEKLMRLPYQTIFFENESERKMKSFLKKVGKKFSKEFLPWALEITPEKAHPDMLKYCGDFWVARLWEEDYREYLKYA